jgi:AcrR family transcriptional regulator
MYQKQIKQVEQACAELVEAGAAITFDAVARRAQIGRATLYRRPELHAVVHEHRQRALDALTLSGLAAQVEQLRVGLEAMAAVLRRHEELLRTVARQSGEKTG